MNFNIWNGATKKKADVIEIIKKSGAEVISINEANDVAVFYEIAKELGYYSFLSVHNKYNVGLLSKYPIIDPISYKLPNLAKSLVEAKIEISKDQYFYVFATHLKALNTYSKRRYRVKEMTAILPYVKAKLDHHPVLFLGDMNEVSHLDRPIKRNFISKMIHAIGLKDSYRSHKPDVKKSPGYTHNVLLFPRKRIDYIYISPEIKVREFSAFHKGFYKPWPSDHAAIMGTFDIPKKKRTESTSTSLKKSATTVARYPTDVPLIDR